MKNLRWELLELRARVRMVDTQLIVLLSRRIALVREIRFLKQAAGLPLFDGRREREVLAHCLDLARSLDVPLDIVHALYAACFKEARGDVATSRQAQFPT